MANNLLVNNPSSPSEGVLFNRWLGLNAPNENPSYSDYDYLNAFRNGLSRDFGTMHFPDTFKFPWHSTFSDQSMYYKPGMSAVSWLGDTPVPTTQYSDINNLIAQSLIGKFLLNEKH